MSVVVKVVYDIDDEKPLKEEERYILEEFRKYKILSLTSNENNFSTPNEESTQKTLTLIIPFFGRDRIFDFPTDKNYPIGKLESEMQWIGESLGKIEFGAEVR